MNMLHKAMTIAGSDASGGAGMEADLKTFQELDVYGMTALTVIVAQNPHKDWDHEIFPIGLDVVEKQIETIVAGIGIDAMKTGMLGSAELVELVARTIDRFKLCNVVIDPVMVC
ncbi:MAG: bifunctional hydroxymethylpyrimidine kinase/phosphomethylpyrimidine kinase, partial [Phascolarctobacterium sp.]|nr:bifunctional hydroxymethylpyrimidine kinase/phosphomethylpyrimidine kinase [Phascolarctobacterium sp.]